MRRLVAVLAFVGFTLGLVVLPATALAQTASPTTSQGGGPGPDPLVSGPYTGTSTFDFGNPLCQSSTTFEVHQVFDGTYTVPGGRTGSFDLDGCTSNVGSATGPFPYSGTFTLTAPNGATMNGAAAGTLIDVVPGGSSVTLTITLTPTGGTRELANVGGVVDLTGTWISEAPATLSGPINGSLAGALTH
jgi:hypothetical protein